MSWSVGLAALLSTALLTIAACGGSGGSSGALGSPGAVGSSGFPGAVGSAGSSSAVDSAGPSGDISGKSGWGSPTGGAATSATASAGASDSGSGSGSKFADFDRDDVDSAVTVISYDPKVESLVVEPIVFMTGHDYCAKFGVSAVDARCSQDLVTEDSHAKVALPVADGAKFFSVKGGDPDCLGTMTGGGTCAVTPAAFARALADFRDMPARLTVRGGEVVRLAQLYTP